MDPTAPKDNPISSPPPSAGSAAPNPWTPQIDPTAQPQPAVGPIEPGQFVAIGGDLPVKPADQLPPTPTTLPPIPPDPQANNGPILGATPPPAVLEPEPGLPNLNMAGASPEPTAPPPPSQPDPTPYIPPPTGKQTQTPPGGASKIKQMRVVFIAAGVLALLLIIGALVWFFLLRPNGNGAASTQSSGQTDVVEAPPLSKVTQGGFGDLPESTGSSQATKSATPSAR